MKKVFMITALCFPWMTAYAQQNSYVDDASNIVEGLKGGENTPTDSTSTVRWRPYGLSTCPTGSVWNMDTNSCISPSGVPVTTPPVPGVPVTPEVGAPSIPSNPTPTPVVTVNPTDPPLTCSSDPTGTIRELVLNPGNTSPTIHSTSAFSVSTFYPSPIMTLKIFPDHSFTQSGYIAITGSAYNNDLNHQAAGLATQGGWLMVMEVAMSGRFSGAFETSPSGNLSALSYTLYGFPFGTKLGYAFDAVTHHPSLSSSEQPVVLATGVLTGSSLVTIPNASNPSETLNAVITINPVSSGFFAGSAFSTCSTAVFNLATNNSTDNSTVYRENGNTIMTINGGSGSMSPLITAY